MDRAGWHVAKALEVPKNITIIHLPPYSPELNPTENCWEFIKSRFLKNRVYKNVEEIINAACEAWNDFVNLENQIYKTCSRDWANIK
jgi:transposase